jgi:phosphoribosyl-ATP pyrophosphohydrolase/phosphoribosyl-AMP cyclohydrolase
MNAIRFDDAGLVPVIAQDANTGEVLMLAYANAEAIDRTRETGLAHFWSRSRGALWRKGDTSGNGLRVRSTLIDCDGDAVLYVVDPEGPACHTGERSCFHRDLDANPASTPSGVLPGLAKVIAQRVANPTAGSYTTGLVSAHPSRLHEKIFEEAAEVVRAARREGSERLAEEAADLIYHLMVLLAREGLKWEDPVRVLAERRAGT